MSTEKTHTPDILYKQAKQASYLEDHANMFRSDGVFSPEISREFFGTKKNFSELSGIQKQQFFEKILADFFTRAIDPTKIQNPQVIEKMEEDYVIFLTSLTPQYISKYSDLESFRIDRSILTITVKGKTYLINLVEAKVGNEDPRKLTLQTETSKKTEELREKISTESYMSGALIVTYEKLSDTTKDTIAAGSIAAATTYGAIGTGQAALSIGQSLIRGTNALLRVTRIGIRNYFGKMEFITPALNSPLNNPAIKSAHENNLFSELQSQGIAVDVPGKSFGRTSVLALSKTKLSVVNTSYESFLKESGQADSRELRKAFVEWKNNVIAQIDDIESSYKISPIKGKTLLSTFMLEGERTFSNVLKRTAGASIHWTFWSIFFRRYHANTQDGAMLSASLAEVGLFTLGAKFGSSYTPGLLRPIVGVVAGGLAVAGGEWAGGAIGLDKKWWSYYPDREDESYKNTGEDGKSVVMSIVTGGEMHALSDMGDADIRIGKREGWDIRVPTWLNAIPGGESLRDVTLPHIDILRKTVDLNTPPWEWMGKTITRNKDAWNKEVVKYSDVLTVDILSFVDQFQRGQSLFRSENIERQRTGNETTEQTKLRILEARLTALFPSGGTPDSWNEKPKNLIIQYVVQLLRENNIHALESITFFVKSTVHANMYLNDTNMTNQARLLRASKGNILDKTVESATDTPKLTGMLKDFSDEISDPEMQKYVLSLFGRILAKKRLVDISPLDRIEQAGKILEKQPSGYWVQTPEFLGQKGKKWIQSKEWTMYHALLDDNRPIQSEKLKIIFGQNVTYSDVFYNLLNMMVGYKRQEEFIKNIVTSETAQKWKLY